MKEYIKYFVASVITAFLLCFANHIFNFMLSNIVLKNFVTYLASVAIFIILGLDRAIRKGKMNWYFFIVVLFNMGGVLTFLPNKLWISLALTSFFVFAFYSVKCRQGEDKLKTS